MSDIEKIIKNGLFGASVGIAADMVLHGGVPIETAAAIGAATGEIFSLSDKSTPKTKAYRDYNYRRRDTPKPRMSDFNSQNNASWSTTQAGIAQGGYNEQHVYLHDGDKPQSAWTPKGAPVGESDSREEGYYLSDFGTPATQEHNPEEMRPRKPIPQDVQASIQKYQGKSPAQACKKYETDMPANSCYSCSGGGMCEHLSLYDGTEKRSHCVYPNTRNMRPLETEPAQITAPAGKPLKSHRQKNRTHLTGIERAHLLNLANKTGIEDVESLKQELGDHIDPALSYSENKAQIQDYFAGVMPSFGQGVTEADIRETETGMNAIDAHAIERANDSVLIETLQARAADGDIGARTELELMQFQREAMQPPAPNIDMSWNSSTPETLEFSKTFVPPAESVSTQKPVFTQF